MQRSNLKVSTWAFPFVVAALPIAVCTWIPSKAAAHDGAAHSDTLALDESTIGSVSFSTTCSKTVESEFNGAVALLHSFWYSAAIRAFEQVLELDNECAMAEWGIAMAHWGNPLAAHRRKAALELGADAVRRARALARSSARESQYIEAVAKLYENHESTSDAERARKYEAAMKALSENYPGDREAAIFYAVALNGTADLTDKSHENLLAAAKILEQAFEAEPNHPGVAHYLIHSYDVPALADRALPAAKKYADIAPAAPHALHMPSHTFTRLGLWRDSIETNIRSEQAALSDGSPAEALHALDYMVYGYLQTAQDDAARAVLSRAREIYSTVPEGDRYATAAAYAASAIPARYFLERGDWAGAAMLESDTSSIPFVSALTHYARGVGAARSGREGKAKRALEQLEMAEESAENEKYWAGRIAIKRKALEAWIVMAGGHEDRAVEIMREAVALENASDKSAISPGPLAPAGESLAEMLLDLGRPAEALSQYQDALSKEPGRFRSLFGAALAADASGRQALAVEYFERLLGMCEDSEMKRPELNRAREYVASAN